MSPVGWLAVLRLREVEIRRFAIFGHLVVRPSMDPERPLTVIRAENGSGKTTFLRALLWGMYGEEGLPSPAARYSVHPASWNPDEEGIETEVFIEFETDGSSRYDPAPGDGRSRYRLKRSVRTIRRAAMIPDEPDFVRVEERTLLMARKRDGRWEQETAGPDAVIRHLLPLALRDFFVMDADKAVDFVGGIEAKPMKKGEVELMTTFSIRSLLGIEIFEQAAGRLDKLAAKLGREASKAIGGQEVAELQGEKDRLDVEQQRLRDEIAKEGEKLRSLREELAECKEELHAEMMRAGAYDSLVQRKKLAEKQFERASRHRDEGLAGLAGGLEDGALLAALAVPALRKVVAGLKPRYEVGAIPLRHLPFVRRLLDEAVCVCGEELISGSERRRLVQEQLDRGGEKAAAAGFQGELYESANALLTAAPAPAWLGRQRSRESTLARASREIDAAARELRDVNEKIGAIDENKIRSLRDAEAATEKRIGQHSVSMGMHELEREDVRKQLETVNKTLSRKQQEAVVGRESLSAQAVAERGADVLKRAYREVQGNQVSELSARMDRLFAQMAANVDGEAPWLREDARESVRMIARVGVRPVEEQGERFEIFALNHRGRAMPPTEINGASRRVLALCFVLALCRESRTHAPLVADSLLNSMSGVVRRNTLEVTATTSDQPVLLLTGSDLEGEAEQAIVHRLGGALYTLTPQWQVAPDGDVVRRTGSDPHVTLLCRCGPREYCRVCERVEQAEDPAWSMRAEETDGGAAA